MFSNKAKRKMESAHYSYIIKESRNTRLYKFHSTKRGCLGLDEEVDQNLRECLQLQSSKIGFSRAADWHPSDANGSRTEYGNSS